MKTKNTKIPLYGGMLTLVKTKNLVKAAKKYGYKIDKSYAAFSAYRICKKTGVAQHLILYRKYNVEYLIHECCHIKNYVMEYCGIKHDFANQEPECYLMDAISSWVLKTAKKL